MDTIDQLKPIFMDIDRNFSKHVSNVQDFLRHPCFSTENYGVKECVDYLYSAIEELDFNPIKIIETDRGNPVIFAEYNAGSERTLLIYAKYDNVGVNVEDWTYDPFEAKIVDNPPYGKCIFARGAHGGHAQPRAFLNTIESILNQKGNLPVNILFVAEGDEELGSFNLPPFVEKYKEQLSKAEALISPGAAAQNKEGKIILRLGGPGILYLELECSGELWGKGPIKFDIHPQNSPIVENPLWRMIKALASMVSEDGNMIHIDGFYNDVIEPSKEEDINLKDLSRTFNLEVEKETRGKLIQFAEGINDQKMLLKRLLYRPGMYITGLTTKAGVIPHRVLAEITVRMRPNQDSKDMFNKIRSHLDQNGFSDISIKSLGGYEWWKTNQKERAVQAVIRGYNRFGAKPEVWHMGAGGEPFSIFNRPPLELPCVGNVALAHGAGGHSPDEYMVIEGEKPFYGLRELEKSYAAILFEYKMLK